MRGCISDNLSSLQCEFGTSLPLLPNIAGKCNPVTLLEFYDAGISVFRMTWDTLPHIESKNAVREPRNTIEELVSTTAQRYLKIFNKSKVQCILPTSKYNLWVELMPGTQSQASRLISLSRKENSTLKKMTKNCPISGITQRITSPWVPAVFFTSNEDGNL